MSSSKLRPLAAACAAALVLLAVPAAASADGDRDVYVSQSGGAETALLYVGGCDTKATIEGELFSGGCADGGPDPVGPALSLDASVPVDIRTGRAADTVTVELLLPGRQPDELAQQLAVTRTDAHHWAAALPAPLVDGSRLDVFAQGGTPPGPEGVWDSASVGTLVVPAVEPPSLPGPPADQASLPRQKPSAALSKLRVKGRSVRATVRLSGAPKATYTAYVALKGKRVSTKVTSLVRSAEKVAVKLDRRTAVAARRSGRLVVRLVTPDGASVTTRTPLR